MLAENTVVMTACIRQSRLRCNCASFTPWYSLTPLMQKKYSLTPNRDTKPVLETEILKIKPRKVFL
jgi:hypothetical protein